MLRVKSNLLPTVSRFLDDEWNSVFDWKDRNAIAGPATLPFVNIKENAGGYIIELAVPGMKKEDFQIDVDNSVLTIKSETDRTIDEQNSGDYISKEFDFKSFRRSFTIDSKIVDDKHIKAIYKDGVLLLSLPKKEEAKQKPIRRIEIS